MDWSRILGLALAALTGAVGVIIWLIRLEGRVNLQDSRCNERMGAACRDIERLTSELDEQTTNLYSVLGQTDRTLHELKGIVTQMGRDGKH